MLGCTGMRTAVGLYVYALLVIALYPDSTYSSMDASSGRTSVSRSSPRASA